MAMTSGSYRQWKVTDLLLHEAEESDLPFMRRLRRATVQLDKLRESRLELIAIDAALDETRDALSLQKDQSLLSLVDEIEDDVERKSHLLAEGLAIALPWAPLDDVRIRTGLEPATKPRKRR
jgi:hypothetical protein